MQSRSRASKILQLAMGPPEANTANSSVRLSEQNIGTNLIFSNTNPRDSGKLLFHLISFFLKANKFQFFRKRSRVNRSVNFSQYRLRGKAIEFKLVFVI